MLLLLANLALALSLFGIYRLLKVEGDVMAMFAVLFLCIGVGIAAIAIDFVYLIRLVNLTIDTFNFLYENQPLRGIAFALAMFALSGTIASGMGLAIWYQLSRWSHKAYPVH